MNYQIKLGIAEEGMVVPIYLRMAWPRCTRCSPVWPAPRINVEVTGHNAFETKSDAVMPTMTEQGRSTPTK
ncbi:hypothetical protein [Paraburkholderia sp. MM5482-R1]|uniref:hypothetical protein n=1 Tax=unclassified Paraburkholderia TaxID=2615204 RepID=UPI003D1AFD0A